MQSILGLVPDDALWPVDDVGGNLFPAVGQIRGHIELGQSPCIYDTLEIVLEHYDGIPGLKGYVEIVDMYARQFDIRIYDVVFRIGQVQLSV